MCIYIYHNKHHIYTYIAHASLMITTGAQSKAPAFWESTGLWEESLTIEASGRCMATADAEHECVWISLSLTLWGWMRSAPTLLLCGILKYMLYLEWYNLATSRATLHTGPYGSIYPIGMKYIIFTPNSYYFLFLLFSGKFNTYFVHSTVLATSY